MTPLIGNLPEDADSLTDREVADWITKADNLAKAAQAKHSEAAALFTNALADAKLDADLMEKRFASAVATYEHFLDCCVARRLVYIHLDYEPS